jgi:hypothetical protein
MMISFNGSGGDSEAGCGDVDAEVDEEPVEAPLLSMLLDGGDGDRSCTTGAGLDSRLEEAPFALALADDGNDATDAAIVLACLACST